MSNKGKYTINDYIALISCALLIVWRPLNSSILPIDGAGRVPFIFLAASTMLFISELLQKRNLIIVVYFSLAIYMAINAFMKGSASNYISSGSYMILYETLTAPMLLVLMTALFVRNFDLTLKYSVIILLVYSALALLDCSFDISHEGRLAGSGVNPNEMALYMVCCIDCLLLMYIRQKMSIQHTILLCIIPFLAIVMSASRMAVTMLMIVLLPTIVLFFNKKNKVRSVLVIFVALVFFALILYLMKNSLIVARFAYTTEQTEEKIFESGTILDLFGDRGVQYYFSWPYFLKNIWTGIGLGNWQNIYFCDLRAHSEFMVMYLENGVIAFAIYVVFIVALFRRSTKKNLTVKGTVYDKSCKFLTAFLVSVLFQNTVMWSYNQYGIFLMYAMILSLPYSVTSGKIVYAIPINEETHTKSN